MNEEVKGPTVEEIDDNNAVIDETTEEEELSPWYYFFSQGCGWCKKTSPVVEELNEAGHDILMLDMAEPDNRALNQELKDEYKLQCGTPWFINADTGKGICGFREKDVLEKWLDGEDIPVPPRPTGPPPKPPFMGSTGKEETEWKKEYKKWLGDNSYMPEDWQKQQKSASEIIDSPRPKSDPPKPPMGPALVQATDEVLDKWGEDMKKWQEENNHLPNLQPIENTLRMIKQRRDQMKAQQGGMPGAPAVDNAKLNSLEAKMTALEVKMDKVINHFGVK
jgi:thiol-disulfide isomerase/thioredoxin